MPAHDDGESGVSNKKSAPNSRGAPGQADRSFRRPFRAALLGSFGLDHLGLTVADRDLAGLLGLGDLTHEIDVQETVLEGSALHLDVVGKLEDALERPRRDALIEHLTALLFVLHLLLALDRQRVFLRLDRKVVLAEAGYGHGDAVGGVAGALDVIGRVAGSGFEAVQHGEKTVEADG